MIDQSINACVVAQTGFALQRNTASYLLLSKWSCHQTHHKKLRQFL